MKKLVSICVLLLAVGACGDDTTPMEPTPEPDPDPPPAAATFTDVQTQVFNARCITHHGQTNPSNPNGGLNLTSGQSYTALVNVTSVMHGEVYVIPNDAQNSFLVKKIEGRQGSLQGGRMPLGQDQLPQNLIDLVRSWIDDGARLN